MSNEQKGPQTENTNNQIVLWLSIGIAIGTSLGIVFDNISIGVALGISLGLVIGAVASHKNKKE